MSAANNVYKNLKAIINYCEKIDPEELERLFDLKYSKDMFNINFPFFINVDNIDESNNKKQSKRFHQNIHIVMGINVRVTSQWTYSNIQYFKEYFEKKDIQPLVNFNDIDTKKQSTGNKKSTKRFNSRFRGTAIGNAQNLLVRNILSSLGNESFNENDWIETKKYFDNKCAYCGSVDKLVIEHAIPINKEKLGEHKIGNIIPSCKKCNSEKGDKDYKDFLDGNTNAITKIETYMDSRNYVPLENNGQLKNILNMAYDEVAIVADRYIKIINELFIQN